MPRFAFQWAHDGHFQHTDAKGYVTVYVLSLQVVRNLPNVKPARGLQLIVGPLLIVVAWV